MAELTPKQEHFAKAYIETGNASEAYRKAYHAEKMKPETVHRKAAELMANGKVTARIEALQAEHKERHKMTIDDILAELEEARQVAKAKENAPAMVAAIMGKAKILGFDKQKIEVEMEQKEEREPLDLSNLTFDELCLLEELFTKSLPDGEEKDRRMQRQEVRKL